MKLNHPQTKSGIALIIVMLVIVVLGMLAAGLAYSMKVETKLARNASAEPEIEMLGLSGVQLASYVLAPTPPCPYDSLNQKWAGGAGSDCDTNAALADTSLKNNELGRGRFSISIIDLERKVNINYASRPVLEKAVDLLGLDLIDSSTIVDSVEDWRDRNENPQVNGAESAYYLGLPKPYVAKDGPIDDLSELLLVRGVTPEIYWGPGGNHRASAPADAAYGGATLAGAVGLFDLFNTVGRMQINVNTAPKEVLQLLPGIDENLAESIVRQRAGLDGVDGTEDDTPFQSIGELSFNVPGMNPQFVQQIQQFCSVRSFTFEVRIDAEIDQYKRRLVALLFRTGSRNVQVLNMHWE
jgi:general secretion pathway protein K